MTLTTNGKNYIAQRFGASNCFVSSGISYTDPAGNPAAGGTADVVSTLKLDDGGLSRGPGGEVYSDIVTANGGAVTNTDIVWIISNDGSPAGEAQYCIGVTPTPTPTPTPSPTPTPTPTPTPPPTDEGRPGGVVTLYGIPTGQPEVELGIVGIEMKQSMVDYHFEINKLGLRLKTGSKWPCVAAVLVKLFGGALTSCPTSGEVFYGADRSAKETLNPFGGEPLPGPIRIRELYPGEIYSFSTDFYQPSDIVGVHTVCIYILANWTSAMLEEEIKLILGLE